MLEIHQELANVASKRERAVLATVIPSRGSAPRKAGAKMLIRKTTILLAPRPSTSVGIIGSKKKVMEVKKRLLQKGLSQQQLDRVYAPIGIEIGAETPEEIAISILTEIIKVKRGA